MEEQENILRLQREVDRMKAIEEEKKELARTEALALKLKKEKAQLEYQQTGMYKVQQGLSSAGKSVLDLMGKAGQKMTTMQQQTSQRPQTSQLQTPVKPVPVTSKQPIRNIKVAQQPAYANPFIPQVRPVSQPKPQQSMFNQSDIINQFMGYQPMKPTMISKRSKTKAKVKAKMKTRSKIKTKYIKQKKRRVTRQMQPRPFNPNDIIKQFGL